MKTTKTTTRIVNGKKHVTKTVIIDGEKHVTETITEADDSNIFDTFEMPEMPDFDFIDTDKDMPGEGSGLNGKAAVILPDGRCIEGEFKNGRFKSNDELDNQDELDGI